MSEPRIHLDNLNDCFEEAQLEIKQIHADGHFADDVMLEGITRIMQIVDGLKKRIQQRKENPK